MQNKCFLESTTNKTKVLEKNCGNHAQLTYDLSNILKFGLYL